MKRSKGLNPINIAFIFLVLIFFYAALPIMQETIDATVPSLNETRDQLIVRATPAILLLVAFTGVYLIGSSDQPATGA